MLKKSLLFSIMFTFFFGSFAIGQDMAPKNWFTKDAAPNAATGSGSDRVYDELLRALPSVPVIVAVIDSGVEADHEDLKDRMWVNKGEIPNNGIDDDKNGYVDDIHGWNFLGNPNGDNVGPDTYESTRLFASLRGKYANADPTKLSKKEKKEYQLYQDTKADVEKKLAFAESQLEQIEGTMLMIMEPLEAVKKSLGRKKPTPENINAIEEGEDQQLMMGKMIMTQILNSGDMPATSMDSIIFFLSEELEKGITHYKNQVEYAYNPDFDSRRDIVKDDYSNYNQKGYGNNDVEGPDAMHGTHVAGIIAATRNNCIGIDGVADNVLIMSVRAVPDGDEHDKDIANAIRYAVDNGAKVINMSFGKGFSPGKKYVDAAVKYAAKKDVLLVHAAGNSAQDNDSSDNFPNDTYIKKKLFGKKTAKNWIEVGALNWRSGVEMVAGFSNYGKTNVDIFAPGVDLYSTVPDQKYEPASGTSMASPVVAGVAALLRSYFPTLKATEIKDIILQSAVITEIKVHKPGSQELIPFSELSATGGYINAYEAVKLAAKKTGKTLSNARS